MDYISFSDLYDWYALEIKYVKYSKSIDQRKVKNK